MSRVLVNGVAQDVPTASTLDAVVRGMTDRPTGVAAAVNGDVVPRHAWSNIVVVDGDQIEVLTAVQGG